MSAKYERELRRRQKRASRGGCSSGKVGYAKRQEALRCLYATRASEMLLESGTKPRDVYRCPECRRWHMTKLLVIE